MSTFEIPTPSEQRLALLQQIQGELIASGWPINSTSLALESSRLVKSGAGILYGFGGFNNKASAQFILAFDIEKIPAAGAVPVFWMTVLASSNFAVSWGTVGRWFDRGIVLTNSSTVATLTIGSADCLFDAQYL